MIWITERRNARIDHSHIHIEIAPSPGIRIPGLLVYNELMTRNSQPAKAPTSLPWNDLYHCTGCTYGVWLPGDPRGFRTRHHRDHVEGDYTSPPPKGQFDALHDRSQQLMSRAPVCLSGGAQRVVIQSMVQTLTHLKNDPYAICLDSHHFHILAQFPRHNPRVIIGQAKRRSARLLSERGLASPGGVWAVRSRAEPIKDERHAAATLHYILNHASRGACIWRSETIDW